MDDRFSRIIIALVANAFFTPSTYHILIVVTLFFMGCFRSIQLSSLNTLAFADVPPAQISLANTLFVNIWQVAAGMGIAFGALILGLTSLFDLSGGGVSLDNYRETQLAVEVLGFISLVGFFKMNAAYGYKVGGFKGRQSV